MSLSVTQQSLKNVGFRFSTQPTLVLVFSLNPSLLAFTEYLIIPVRLFLSGLMQN
ncbi:hypothetical protein GXM_03985 [Nostoc sphaeroides CCNUC1]|uniref:Uncharacterized protein n=1 Tax=Nostoc sphaeroides CCNUC1 TaxID=2653204 RepID=A0A5P8W1N1_9NOSO|nr:hypothetical protein GXM_03985 [Nostoc sphaeroides CCNUC1]